MQRFAGSLHLSHQQRVEWSHPVLIQARNDEACATDGRTRDAEIVDALRRGDERAFLAMVKLHHASMLRVASMFVSSAAVAEEVVQEAWLGVLNGLDSFAGRSSLRGWIFSIVTNCAKTRGIRESRSSPFSSFDEPGEDEPAVDPSRFLGPDHPRWPGHWASPPEQWAEDKLLTKEMVAFVHEAIETLPANQRRVITLRDVEGWTSAEVTRALGISEVNERVLLHRARSKVRAALELRMKQEGSP
ncbi:MAG TPA: RNA polymerase sigma factor [Myxococcales bacterium]|nr:RNA polymerase sigma factor [Myxococcales bacterium]